MAAGQTLNVVVCATLAPGPEAGQLAGPALLAVCPEGMQAYLVESYVPFSGSAQFFDGLMRPFDNAIAAGFFSFGFGVVVAFFLLGLKGSLILRPFWGYRS